MFARTFCRLCCTGYSIIINVVFLCYLSSYIFLSCTYVFFQMLPTCFNSRAEGQVRIVFVHMKKTFLQMGKNKTEALRNIKLA